MLLMPRTRAPASFQRRSRLPLPRFGSSNVKHAEARGYLRHLLSSDEMRIGAFLFRVGSNCRDMDEVQVALNFIGQAVLCAGMIEPAKACEIILVGANALNSDAAKLQGVLNAYEKLKADAEKVTLEDPSLNTLRSKFDEACKYSERAKSFREATPFNYDQFVDAMKSAAENATGAVASLRDAYTAAANAAIIQCVSIATTSSNDAKNVAQAASDLQQYVDAIAAAASAAKDNLWNADKALQALKAAVPDKATAQKQFDLVSAAVDATDTAQAAAVDAKTYLDAGKKASGYLELIAKWNKIATRPWIFYGAKNPTPACKTLVDAYNVARVDGFALEYRIALNTQDVIKKAAETRKMSTNALASAVKADAIFAVDDAYKNFESVKSIVNKVNEIYKDAKAEMAFQPVDVFEYIKQATDHASASESLAFDFANVECVDAADRLEALLKRIGPAPN